MSVPARPDEGALWDALRSGERPRAAGVRLNIPPNRVRYLCEKWARKGVYTWGVTHDLGWIVSPTHRPAQLVDEMAPQGSE